MDVAVALKDCSLHNYCNVFTFPNHAKYVVICGEKDREFLVEVSDGERLWTAQLSSDMGLCELQRQIKMANVAGVFKWIKHCLDTADLDITLDNDHLRLSLGKKPRPVGQLQLAESPSGGGARSVVFRLASLASQLRREVTGLHASVDRLERQQASTAAVNTSPGSGQRGGGEGSSRGGAGKQSGPRVVGMSRVNPANRKRKVARGVVFGGGEEGDSD